MEEEHRPVPRDELEEDIEHALWKTRKLLLRKVEPGNFNPYRAARAVIEHLELCGITCYRSRFPCTAVRAGVAPARIARRIGSRCSNSASSPLW